MVQKFWVVAWMMLANTVDEQQGDLDATAQGFRQGGTTVVTKIYALVWLLAAGAASLVYFTGNLNEVTITIFGFIFSTILFTGLVAVLPWWLDRRYSWNYEL